MHFELSHNGAVLIVRGTKKLRDCLKTAAAATLDDVSTTALGDWFGTVLTWQPQAVLLVNTQTLLPVLVPLAPTATLLQRIPACVADALRSQGIDEQLVANEMASMSPVRIAPTNDRQMLGVMNELTFQAQHARARGDEDLRSLSAALATVILGPLARRHGTPADELRAHFSNSATILPFRRRTTSKAADSRPAPGQILQLKVTLRDISPPVWRRIVVDGGRSLHHLHDVIQAAFDWYDLHEHEFEIDGEQFGVCDTADDPTLLHDERRVRIDRVLGSGPALYVYDLGDNWVHDIVVEASFDAVDFDRKRDDPGTSCKPTVPDCVDGERMCPPEDSGGAIRYAAMLEVIADAGHCDHADVLDWLTEATGKPSFDPDEFDPGEFSDRRRRQRLFDPDDEWLA